MNQRENCFNFLVPFLLIRGATVQFSVLIIRNHILVGLAVDLFVSYLVDGIYGHCVISHFRIRSEIASFSGHSV